MSETGRQLLRRSTSPRCEQTPLVWTGAGLEDFERRPCLLVKGHWGRCASEGETPDAGNYNDEDAWNYETGAPLCSSKTERTAAGMRWVGCDHREPYADFRTTCRCGTTYTFTTYTPQ